MHPMFESFKCMHACLSSMFNFKLLIKLHTLVREHIENGSKGINADIYYIIIIYNSI